MAAIYLLAPQPPMIFMGEEYAASTPFLFFCDFGKELAKAVTEGRRNEFSAFRAVQRPSIALCYSRSQQCDHIRAVALDWASIEDPFYRQWLDLYRRLLRLRQERVVPLLKAPPHLIRAMKCAMKSFWRIGSPRLDKASIWR